MKFKRVDQVARWRLCTGCGACAAICPQKAISLVDVLDQGIRPKVDLESCQKCGHCVEVCPGIGITHELFNTETIPELRLGWGPILEVWEGYATDPDIRYNGSSGGVTTALAFFCLEIEQASGVLHIGTNPEAPLQNVPVFSKNRQELLAFTGSRYSPAAPCQRLDWIEGAESNCVFIGKPCDVVALRKLQSANLALASKVSLAISIFCAGTPSTRGTKALLDTLDAEPDDVAELRYRGRGWPGMTTVKFKGGNGLVHQVNYEESWGKILCHYGQFRCRLCPDSTGEFADISCGDPWYRRIEPDEPGWSLALVRTKRGKEILRKAIKAGYVTLEPVESSTLPRSQKALLNRRRHLFGRLLSMKVVGIPTPKFIGFSLFANWQALSLVDKIRSIASTMARIVCRGWFRPQSSTHQGPPII